MGVITNYSGGNPYYFGVDNSGIFKIYNGTYTPFSTAGYTTTISGNGTNFTAGNSTLSMASAYESIVMDPYGVGAIQFKAGGSGTTERMRITDGGNVGIGTISPATKLHVSGTVGLPSAELLTNTTDSSEFVFYPAAVGTVFGVTNAKDILFGGYTTPSALSGWTERMRITTTGLVGIGTTSPGAKLDVNGALRTTPVALTAGASVATDASLGNYFTLTANQNFTLANPTNSINGQKVVWRVKQDATGGRTIALDANFRVGSTISSVTLSTGANKVDYIGAIYDATDGKWDVIAYSKGY